MRFRWWWTLSIIFLAFVIGATNLYDGIVSQAEVNSLRHIALHHQPDTKPIPEILASIFRFSPQHAPLYFLTLKYWYEAFGTDPGMIRLLSIFWSVLTVAMVYRLGVSLGGWRTGWFASLLIVSSWAFMYYSHEIRQYAFLLFISTAVVWVYWRIVTYKGRIPLGYWLALYVFSAMSIYIHYFGAITLLGLGAYHVAFVRKNRRWLTVGVVEALAGLTFLPWLSIMLRGMRTMPDLSDRILPPLAVLYEFLFFHSNGLWFVLLGLFVLVIWRMRHLTDGQRFAVFVLAVMVAAIFVIHQVRPILFVGRLRYIIIFLPMVAVVGGIGLTQLGRFQRFAMMIPVVMFISALVFVRSDILHDYTGLDRTPPYDEILMRMETMPGMFEPLVSLGSDEDGTVVSFQVRDYYGKLSGHRVVHFNDSKLQDSYRDEFARIAEDGVGFWLLHWSDTVPLDEMTIYRDLILKSFQPCGVYIEDPDMQLYLMLEREVSCDVVSEMPLVVYDTGVQLSSVWAEVNDDTLDVYVWWDDIPFEEYGVSLQVFDTNGDRILQDDFVVVEGLHHRQLAWNNTDAGRYEIHMILYTLDDVSSIGGQYMPDSQPFDRSFVADTIVIDG